MAKSFGAKEGNRLLGIALNIHDEDALASKIDEAFSGIWDDKGAWAPLGGRVDSDAVTKGQQSQVSAAFKELKANSLDAIMERILDEAPKRGLVSEERARGIEAMDPSAAWREAVQLAEKLFPGTSPVREVDGLLQIGLCGDRDGSGKDKPSLVFADRGAGRSAGEFQASFLSVANGAKNKRGTPCLMGQYGMGSTGIHSFSGRYGIKLIVSRRSEADPWGVALLRYGGEGNIECLMPGGKIIEADAPEISPFRAHGGERWDRPYGNIQRGTVVKCYSVSIEGKEAEHGRALNWFAGEQLGNMRFSRLPEGLHVRYIDMRYAGSSSAQTKGGADTRVSNGLFGNLDEEIKKSKRKAKKSEADEKKEGAETKAESQREALRRHEIRAQDNFYGTLLIRVYDLGEDSKRRIAENGLGNCRIFHHLHGQAHYLETREGLVRSGLHDLADRILVEVDASAMSPAAAGRVWMSNRESVLANQVGSGYKEMVRAALAGDQTLKEWAIQELARKLGESEGTPGEAARRASGSLGVSERAAGKRKGKRMRLMAAMAVEEEAGETGWEGVARGCLDACAEKALPAAESLEEAKKAALAGMSKKSGGGKEKAGGKGARKSGEGAQKKRDPKSPGKAELSKEAKKAYGKGLGGVRLEKVLRSDKAEIDADLFRVASCDGKVATIVAAAGREKDAEAALFGQEIAFLLSVEAEGKKTFFSARGVYRSEGEQAMESMAKIAEANRRASGKLAERIVFREGRSSPAKGGETGRRDLRKEPGFSEDMAVYCEAAGSHLVITSNIDHVSFRGLSLSETDAAIGPMWESSALVAAGNMALDKIKADSGPEDLDQIAREINAVASGIGSGAMAILRLAVESGKKGRKRSGAAAYCEESE